MEDIVQKSYTTHSPSRSITNSTSTTNYGTGSETYDADFTTYYGIAGDLYTPGSGTVTVIDEHTWDGYPKTILRVITKVRGKKYKAYNCWITYDVWLYYSSDWHSVSSTTLVSDLDDTRTLTVDIDSIANVTGVRVQVQVYVLEEGQLQAGESPWSGYVYETQVFAYVKKSYAGVV